MIYQTLVLYFILRLVLLIATLLPYQQCLQMHRVFVGLVERESCVQQLNFKLLSVIARILVLVTIQDGYFFYMGVEIWPIIWIASVNK
jgi:hypothetical protein